MTILHLACLNNDPDFLPFLGQCAPVGEEPRTYTYYSV